MPFALEYDDMRDAFRIASMFAVLTIVLSLSVLCLSLWVHLTPSARPHIERLSWRLFMVVLGNQVLWASIYLITYSDPTLAIRVGKTHIGCSVVMTIMTGCRLMNSWLIASIAVNLALSVRWNVNCTKSGREKWYIIGSAVAGFTPPFAAALQGHFRGGSRYNTCYFASVAPYSKYILRRFLAFHLWLALSTLIALIAVVISMTSIFSQSRRTSQLIRRAAQISHAALQQQPSSDETLVIADDIDIGVKTTRLDTPPSTNSSEYSRLLCYGMRKRKELSTTDSRRPSGHSRRMSMYSLDDAFSRIAIRVAVYPVMAVILNSIYIATDIFFFFWPNDLPNSYIGLYMLSISLYAGRGAIFAMIAISIDPCFRQGVKAAWKARKADKTPGPQLHSAIYTSPKSDAILLPGATHPIHDPNMTACSFWDMLHPHSKSMHVVLSPPVSPMMLDVGPPHSVFGIGDLELGVPELEVAVRRLGQGEIGHRVPPMEARVSGDLDGEDITRVEWDVAEVRSRVGTEGCASSVGMRVGERQDTSNYEGREEDIGTEGQAGMDGRSIPTGAEHGGLHQMVCK